MSRRRTRREAEQAAQRLAELEAVIERGLHRYLEVGEALLAIYYDDLTPEEYKDFPNYLRRRFGPEWSLVGQMANRRDDLVDATFTFDTTPNYDQQRSVKTALAAIEDRAERNAVWRAVVTSKLWGITAADVTAMVETRRREAEQDARVKAMMQQIVEQAFEPQPPVLRIVTPTPERCVEETR